MLLYFILITYVKFYGQNKIGPSLRFIPYFFLFFFGYSQSDDRGLGLIPAEAKTDPFTKLGMLLIFKV